MARTFTPALQGFAEASVASAPAVAATARPAIRRRDVALPSWVVFCMIMLATFAVCVTVTMRTHAEMSNATQKFDQMNNDVEKLRSTNVSLKNQVEKLRTDPRAIESAARTRLNMVRANEVVVPLD